MLQNWTPGYLSKLPLTILSWVSGPLAISHCLQVPIYKTLGHISMAAYASQGKNLYHHHPTPA